MIARIRRGSLASVLVSFAVALAGCSTMAPPYERPPAPVAERFGSEAAAARSGTPAPELEWQRFFADERLQRLITLALENNRDLRIAVLNIEQARAQYQIRRSEQWPTLNAGLSGSRQPTGNNETTTSYSAGLLVTSYELDVFGRVRSLSDAALSQYLATGEARKAVQISLVAAVAHADLTLRADDELLRVTRQTLATREESLELARVRFRYGATSESDVKQAESLYEGARVALALLSRQRAVDENTLVLLLGRPLPGDLPPAAPIAGHHAFPEVPAGLPSEVLTLRPDIRAAEQQLIAAHANIGAARAAFFPKITLTTGVGTASDELSGLFGSGSFAWSLTGQLLQPIFDAGRLQANLELAQANRDVAVAQYERAIQNAFREVSDALAGRAYLGDQVRAQRAQARAEEAGAELAELRYRNGAASYLDVLVAQRASFAAQLALVQVRSLELQNQVSLYKVLGGGWTEVVPTP